MDYIDLRALQVFVAVCDRGSMTRAAKALSITQSAVSQKISDIERFIGVRLLDRSLRPLRPTPAGYVLYQRGRHILREAKEAHILSWQYGTGTLPRLRVGLNPVLSQNFTAQFVKVLRQQTHPPDVVVWNRGDSDHIRGLINRDLDLIISTDAAEHLEGYERHTLARESFILLVPATMANEAACHDFNLLSKELPLIRYSGRTRVGEHVERYFRRIRLNLPHHIELESADAAVKLVADGHGWCVLTPLNLLHARGKTAKVKALPLPGPGSSRYLTLVTREGEYAGFPEQFASICRDILRQHILPELAETDTFVAANFHLIEGAEADRL